MLTKRAKGYHYYCWFKGESLEKSLKTTLESEDIEKNRRIKEQMKSDGEVMTRAVQTMDAMQTRANEDSIELHL